ncbi:MAG: hypothetical protein CVV49_08970 [Spirochaetae bacterium HGW-Spirochaetae-5]|nr:MAG: hypothetical protein CVV49_08970 [Spirochaetae bacterium HGW-Spirochaetae-5]
MNSIQINTSRKLKGVKPSSVRRVGFLKLKKMYVYNFTSPSDYWRVLGKNRDLNVTGNKVVTGGIIRGSAV